MVQVTPDGTVYAFVVGADLIQAAEPRLSWQTISKDGFGGELRLALCSRSDEPQQALRHHLQSGKQSPGCAGEQ